MTARGGTHDGTHDGGAGDGLVVAAFDLDGTLTTGHSTLDFVTGLAGWPRVVRAAARGVVAAGVPPSRSAWKEATIGAILRGRPEVDVRAAGREFAARLVDERLIRDAADRLAGHRAAGHEVVLVSAALDVYVDHVAELLGASGVVATTVEVVDGRCTGRILDADLRDERKVERLQAWLGDRAPTTTVHAYGNSEDDEEMQAYAARTQERTASRRPS